jgi:hypothetical protein
MLKFLFISLIILLMGCASQYNIVKVEKGDSQMIDNWKSNNIKIISIDTCKDYYIVKYK